MSTIEAIGSRSAHSTLARRSTAEKSAPAQSRGESLIEILGPVRVAGLTIALVATALITGWALFGSGPEGRTQRAAQRIAEAGSSSSRPIAIALTATLVLGLFAGWASLRSHRAGRD